ncbi:PLC-like phosphodiesterase [Clavulina sp. PMI_390]|nr:PLC-like phosphodiesterase [Clavulina sp. PMI_390]
MLFGVTVLGLAALSPLANALATPRATVCNGHAELCSRNYANVTYIGSHDSYAIDTDVLDLSSNQDTSITAQLNLGVRMLQSQAHLSGSTLELCHTSHARDMAAMNFASLSEILMDQQYDSQTFLSPRFLIMACHGNRLRGSLQSYLTTVKSWLDANPNEVLTLLITNGDAISISEYWVPAFTNANIIQYTYVPPSSTSGKTGWPTLGEMIDAGTRLVVFMDYNSDTSVAPYILPEFNYVWETPYDVTDSSFPCSVDRGTSSSMLMINHFLDLDILGIDIPDRSAGSTTNSEASILANAYGCLSLNSGDAPTFVLLDWVDKGAAITAANYLNGLS